MQTTENKYNASDKEENKSKYSRARRKRRHWYDHEKIAIIKSYDNGELLKIPGEPSYVTDPKSNETLSVFAIEDWRDHFRTLGILSGKTKPMVQTKVTQPVVNTPVFNEEFKTQPTQESVKVERSMQTLLIKTLIENEKLKETVQELRKYVTPRKNNTPSQDYQIGL